MTIHSMTGFARITAAIQGIEWKCEIKSVNGRNMDLRLRLPEGFEAMEIGLRTLAAKHVRRGNLVAQLEKSEDAAGGMELNVEFLKKLLDLRDTYRHQFDQAPLKLDQVLQIPGMLSRNAASLEVDEKTQSAISDLFVKTLAALNESRAREGANLGQVIKQQIETVESLTADAEKRIAPQAESMRVKMAEQLAAFKSITGQMDEQRLAQELAFQAAKADVREEIDRLKAHVAEAQSLLRSNEPVGRKLDFLAQEFNREANTLCSKSSDIELSRIGLELKTIIDQFREQVQNIE